MRFGPGVLAAGMDPLGFIRYLQTFCEIRTLKVLDDQLPPPAQMDPETCYLGFEMELRTASGKATIESAFEFGRPRSDTTTETYRGVAGLQGDIGSGWDFEVYAQYGRTDFASSGRISGSGLASARMMGLSAMDLTMSAVIAPAAEHPSTTSAPTIASASVRAGVARW